VQWAQPDLAQQVGQVLRDAQIDPGMLELEVTDRVAMRNERLAASVLRELHALGVQIALDDFGTGLCSLAAVHRFPIRALKIDRSLIETLASGSLALVQAIINAAHSLDVRVVAQGVETPQQLALLSEHGCDEASGYLLAAPCPADGLERWFD
jgi:EAL domain-containing protein (putative c-di-GMP-specific phosphodiesterase class I)